MEVVHTSGHEGKGISVRPVGEVAARFRDRSDIGYDVVLKTPVGPDPFHRAPNDHGHLAGLEPVAAAIRTQDVDHGGPARWRDSIDRLGGERQRRPGGIGDGCRRGLDADRAPERPGRRRKPIGIAERRRPGRSGHGRLQGRDGDRHRCLRVAAGVHRRGGRGCPAAWRDRRDQRPGSGWRQQVRAQRVDRDRREHGGVGVARRESSAQRRARQRDDPGDERQPRRRSAHAFLQLRVRRRVPLPLRQPRVAGGTGMSGTVTVVDQEL